MKNLSHLTKLIVPAIISCFILQSCASWNAMLAEIPSAEAALNDAIGKLENQSASWQATLNELTTKLSDESQSTLRNEVQNLLNNGIAAAGSEFRCNADFVGNRIKDSLQRMLAELKGNAAAPRMPILCQVVPGNIDMSLPAGRRNLIVVSGYNFENQSTLKLYTVSGNEKTDVTHALSRLTDYELRLNLGANGVMPTVTTDRIQIEYNGVELTRVPVIQVAVPDCKTGELIIPASGKPLDVMPGLTAGDPEFYSNGPRCSMRIELLVDGREIKARLSMSAEEINGDTKANGTKDIVVYQAPAEIQILEIISDKVVEQSYVDETWETDLFTFGPAEAVSRFECMGDAYGDDVGTITRMRAYLNPIRIRYKEIMNCK